MRKINLLHLRHRKCFMKKVALKTFLNIHRNVAALQFYLKKTPTQMFSSEYYEFLRTPILKKKLLMSA